MKKNISYKVAVTSIVCLFTTNAYAATVFSSEGHLSLIVSGFSNSSGNNFDFDNQPADIAISGSDNSADDDFSSTFVGDAEAEGVSTAFADSELIKLDTQATGFAGSPYAFAQSDATASANVLFENNSVSDYTIDLILSYSYTGDVATDTPANQQNGIATIDIDLFGDFSFSHDLNISEQTELGQGSFSGFDNNLSLSFLLAAGESENIFANIFSYGESESSTSSVSQVPVPGAFFLMAPAVAALLFRKKGLRHNSLKKHLI